MNISSIEHVRFAVNPTASPCFDALQDMKIDLGKAVASRGLKSDISEHTDMIIREFSGKSCLELYAALLNVYIRREIDIHRHFTIFMDLWHHNGEFLLQNLGARWLVSCCDTIADHHSTSTERLIAASASLWFNTIKLYETEHLAIERKLEYSNTICDGMPDLFDDISAFAIGHGDMISNLMHRMNNTLDSDIASRILRRLLLKAHEHDTVYRRFRCVHENIATKYDPKGVLTSDMQTFEEISWLFSCDNRNRGIIRQNIDEAALLWSAVKRSEGSILEIGRRFGGTTVLLCKASNGRKVTSIDNKPEHHNEVDIYFKEYMQNHPKSLELLIADSRIPLSNRSFGLLFIDGDHSYEGVKSDTIAHWSSLMPISGKPALAVFHDAVVNDGLKHDDRINHCDGVKEFCEELVNSGCAKVLKLAGSSLLVEKIRELPDSWVVEGKSKLDIDTSQLSNREDVIQFVKRGGIGIELGVAEGIFSERIIQSGYLNHLYSVDMYAGDRGHDIDQYKRAIKRLSPYHEKNSLLKMRFNEAIDLFADEYFDFIYVDGYAHNGEEDGQTIRDWYKKLKPGGIFAGDDYDEKWPLVIQHVDEFIETKRLKLNIINCHENIDYCRYPTWFIIKP